jgi:hypothetical protein
MDTHRLPSQNSRIGGVLTKATMLRPAEVQEGSAAGVLAVKLTEYTPLVGAGGAGGVASPLLQPAPTMAAGAIQAALDKIQCAFMILLLRPGNPTFAREETPAGACEIRRKWPRARRRRGVLRRNGADGRRMPF